MTNSNHHRGPHHAGITLVEIMISIMILGIGLVSLATLFPIGLLRLREAQRQTRSAYLLESAASDMAARGLLTSQSFTYADLINYQYSQAPFNFHFPLWYVTATAPTVPGGYNPLTHDAGTYGPRIPYVPANPDPNAGIGDFGPLSAPAVTACHSPMIRSGGTRRATLCTPTSCRQRGFTSIRSA